MEHQTVGMTTNSRIAFLLFTLFSLGYVWRGVNLIFEEYFTGAHDKTKPAAFAIFEKFTLSAIVRRIK